MSGFQGQAGQSQWRWSERLRQYYRIDHQQRSYVLKNGRSVTANELGIATPPANGSSSVALPGPQPTARMTTQRRPSNSIYGQNQGQRGNAGQYVSGSSSQYAQMGAQAAHASQSVQASTSTQWTRDMVPQYRLTKAIIEGFLKEKFGMSYDYKVEVLSAPLSHFGSR